MSIYRTIILKGWWLILLVLIAAAVLLGIHIPKLNVDAGTNVLLNENDPDLAFYNSSRPDWGYDEYAYFCVVADDWFTTEGQTRLREIVEDLKNAKQVLNVVSILEVPLLYQVDWLNPNPFFVARQIKYLGRDAGEVDLERARKEFLGDPDLLARNKELFPENQHKRSEMNGHTQALGNLVSRDGRSLGLLVYLDVNEDTKKIDKEWSYWQGQKFDQPEKAVAQLDMLRPRFDEANAELKRRRDVMLSEVRRVAAKWSPKLAESVKLSGVSVINVNLIEHVQADLRIFGIASFLFFVFAFLLIYRKIRFVVLPIVTCLFPVLIIIGAMAFLEMKITVITSNLPVLLFVLMLPYTVYFIERYRERRAQDPSEEKSVSTMEAARAIFIACLFSATTTMAGFASLSTSGIKPVRNFGVMMSLGMGIGLVIVFLAIPSMSRPLRALPVRSAGTTAGTSGLVRLFELVSLRKPLLVLLFSLVLLGGGLWGATRLNAETKFTEYFWPNSEVYQGLEYIDKELGGTTSLEIILRSDKKDHFKTREGLNALRAAAEYFDDLPETGNVTSLENLVFEIRKYLPERRKGKKFGPKDKQLVGMLQLLAPSILRQFVYFPEKKKKGEEQVVNDQPWYQEPAPFSVSRVFVRFKETAPTLHRNNILKGLHERLNELKKKELKDLNVRATGVFQLYANMLNSLIESQKETFLIVLLAILGMLVILFRSPILAVIVLLPQVLPAVVMLGIMGWVGIPLDLVTVMIASIAMGVGIDAAIQYTIRYRTELAVDGDRRAALSRAHATIGRAIWIATSVIVAGFCVLMLSQFVPSVWFGLFTAIAMLMSQFAALTTLPALFLLTGYPRVKVKTS